MMRRGRWRLFRQDAGRVSGPPAWVYVLLFAICVTAGNWSGGRFLAVVVWPANGVLLTAVLQLHRRKAIAVMACCFVINLIGNAMRGSAPHMILIFALFNQIEVFAAGMIARRFCGAALDLRRPKRLARFTFLAVAPPAAIMAALGVMAIPVPWDQFLVSYQTWCTVDALGLLIVAPTLLLLARSHRFEHSRVAPWRKAAMVLGLAVVTAAVFAQSVAPISFVVFLPLMLIAFQLPPHWSAVAVILVSVIATGFSLTGHGPFVLAGMGPAYWPKPATLPALRLLPVLQLFMASVLAVALTASTFLTERRRLVARLKARTEAAIKARVLAEQAAASKARFLSVMSHELRTPLNGVSGFAELLAARPCLDEEGARQVEHIRRASGDLLRLVEDILDFSLGGTEAASAPFLLAELIRELALEAREAAEAKGLSFVLAADPPAGQRVLGDERRVRQMLRALLSNAVKFTPQGEIVFTARLSGEVLEASVADTGPGLAQDLLPVLFHPFSQADASISRVHGGAGMGLALCKRLLDGMDGEISGENRLEGGAIFRIRLPMRRAEAAAVALAEEAEARAPRVLVVDDHPVNREVAVLMLQSLGCETATACDGVEAVEAVRVTAFDLVLMDVRMPRMDGLEATRRIRALPPQVHVPPIVAVTADAMPEDVARCVEAGMTAHLAKPLTLARLLDVLGRHLGGTPDPAHKADAGQVAA